MARLRNACPAEPIGLGAGLPSRCHLTSESADLCDRPFFVRPALGVGRSADRPAGRIGPPEETRRKLLKCIGAKNLHELRALCREAGAKAEKAQQLEKLAAAGGCPEEVLPLLRALPCPRAAVKQLEALAEGFRAAGLEDMLRIDFSVVNDMQYYNGIVFRGFVYGVPAGVLSGGQYDRLMRKMGRSAGAIGFAVYLDELERIVPEDTTPDADVLLLYDESVSPARICRETRALTAAGKTVMAQQREPDRGVFGQVRRLTEKEDRDA